jgi:hypothetical protein
MLKVITLSFSIFFLTACIAPQANFPLLPGQTFSNNTPQSQHDKLSKRKADEFITIGETDIVKVGFHYGEPNVAMINSDGDNVWMYQAKSVLVGVKYDSGTNVNTNLSAFSSATSQQGQTEVSAKSTMLRITFNSAGIVTSYDSQTTSN